MDSGESITKKEGLASNALADESIVPDSTQNGRVEVLKDGFQLHPRPTSDPLDPLNWTSVRKHSILAIVMFKYFLFTYITTTTVPSFSTLQATYDLSLSQVNWTVAIPALGLAVGPLLWSSAADIIGRRPIFVFGTVIALVATIGAAKASSFGGYMTARFFQGLGVSPAATVGLAVVNDMFYSYERGQKIGLWVLAIDTGLLVGPIVGGFIDLVSAEWVQWLTAILFGLLLLLEIVFMSETLYPRAFMLTRAPSPAAPVDVEKRAVTSTGASLETMTIPRTTALPFLNLRPLPGLHHPHIFSSVSRFIFVFRYPVIPLVVMTFCFAWYWWILSVITMIPTAYAQYSPQKQGLLFLGLLLGTLVSEVLCSGSLSDWLVATLAKRNGGVRTPEMRLWLGYPAAALSAVGLVIWGMSIDRNYHWMIGQVALFLFAAGIQIGNTVTSSYIVDAYPLQSMSMIVFYSVFLNTSAFIDPFFIVPWQASNGWTMCFAIQGILTFFISVPVFGIVHVWGEKLRKWSGNMNWVDPEFGE